MLNFSCELSLVFPWVGMQIEACFMDMVKHLKMVVWLWINCYVKHVVAKMLTQKLGLY